MDNKKDMCKKPNEIISFLPLKYVLSNESAPIRVGPFGSQLSEKDFLPFDSGYCVYNQRNILDNDVKKGNLFISQNKYESMSAFHVKSGDTLITTRGTIGRIARISDNFLPGILHPCLIRFRLNDDLVDYNYLELVFNYTDYVLEQIIYKSNATTIEVIYSNTLRNIIIPLWNKDKQVEIWQYLSQKTAQIDHSISLINQSIEKLKEYKQSLITEAVNKGLDPDVEMKDSGVEWIGKINGNFDIYKLKNISSCNNEVLNESTDGEYGIKYIDISSVSSDGAINEIKEFIFSDAPSRARRIVHTNDIIISTVRTYLKQIAFINDSYNNFICSTGFAVFTANTNRIYPKFLYYFFQNQLFLNSITLYSKGIAYPAIDAIDLLNLPIVVPSKLEQENIIKFLDQKCSQIDSLITEKQKLRDKLTAYKKSLIYEYVTGKAEVSA